MGGQLPIMLVILYQSSDTSVACFQPDVDGEG